jgi:8-oxo-dGTP pyrophosphatase MutT (NUDIX family)
MGKERTPAIAGNWGETTRWELFITDELPPRELCSAVYCIPIEDDGKIWLMCDEDRGWGVIGGHIEPRETIEQTLLREAEGENGGNPVDPQMFAAMRITASEPMPHQDEGREYPFPISYQVYFHSGISGDAGNPKESDSLASRAFTLEEIEQLGISDFPIIKLAYEAYRQRIIKS